MNRLLVSVSAGALAALCSTTAMAQQAPPERAPERATVVDEVIVTAQRREQAAQDVGIALSVLSGESLIQQGVTNVNQLQNATPNLEVEPAFGGGAAQFRLRGVGFQDYASNNSPTVGVYVNEVAYPVPVMTQGLIFDIDRVEVLRGPQGTLYGRNTTGGAISFVTKRPTEELSAGLMTEWGSHEQFRAEGYVSGPVAGGLRGRLAVSTEQGGAWQTNRVTGESLGDADRTGARALLAWDPSETLSFLLDVHGGIDKSENQGLYLLSDLRTRGGTGPVIPADKDRSKTGWGLSPRFAAEIGRDVNAKPGRDNSSWGTSLNANLALKGMNLNSISSFETLKRDEYGDWDSSASVEADTFFGSDVDVMSQELRLSSDNDSALTWVAGFYYSRQELNERYSSDFIDIYGTYAQVTYDQKVESWSLFGQAEYAFTDQLKAILGLRYEEETRELEGFGSAFGGATALPPTTVDTKMTPLTGKAALEFKPADNLLLYGSISRGAKSGGFTTYNTGNRSGIEPFDPEILWAYEVGFKADPSRAVQVNGAAYYYDYNGQQVLSAVCGANGPVGRFTNADSKIYGAELEGVFRPAAGLRISQSVSYKKGEYTDFLDLDIGKCQQTPRVTAYIDKSGDEIPFPALSYAGSISYDWTVSGFAVTAETNYSYRDEYPSWLGPKYDVEAYWLANASVTVGPEAANWSVTFWARNLFDQEYDLTRNFFTSADIAQPGRPRTIGARLSLQY
ncbi:outer membrane receptor protein involved in Fe transport [Brevundimonas bullata]|uniref:Outer membrane receptor protein involved in Fe transport n=1 Tax=Brevundimonas bullata TaxID=13160 RepID=A0A7W7N4V9_9CAUL|nr:TonB-dependent receptor [Brevundimonas bullata]MBB4798796.1 outer membrane receptor protein involved in Fe transport [Brevundimonas bullata]MBB6383756.1 outer membrane receptor protein involved in Fe transport [Brevundimonas bullata]